MDVTGVDARSQRMLLRVVHVHIISPTAEKFPHLKESLREQQPKVIYENPTAQHHFHLEYQLLPGVDQSCYKTDVVVYGGVVAKVFTDSDARVVRTWEEDGKMWYGWTHK